MEFVRTIINSDDLNSIVPIPEELKHRQVEVLIFPVDKVENKGNADFNPDSYAGILHLSDDELETGIKSIRDEWERF